MATAALIFAADESGTLALIAFAICSKGLMRSRAAPEGGVKRGTVESVVEIVRVPCAVSTLRPSFISGVDSCTFAVGGPSQIALVRRRLALCDHKKEDAAEEEPRLSGMSGVRLLSSTLKKIGHSTEKLGQAATARGVQ